MANSASFRMLKFLRKWSFISGKNIPSNEDEISRRVGGNRLSHVVGEGAGSSKGALSFGPGVAFSGMDQQFVVVWMR